METHPPELITTEQVEERLNLSRSPLCPPDSPEIITLEEFAAKMKVSETTVWKWLRHGNLRPGRHYIQIERVIRFHWCRELVERLHEDCSADRPEKPPAQRDWEDVPEEPEKQRYGKRINFDI